MAVACATGCSVLCSFGSAPGTLLATSQSLVLADGMPVCTTRDITFVPPGPTFVMCNSPVFPLPKPCAFVPEGVWIPGNPKVLVDGKPLLTNSDNIRCSAGQGIISVVLPGQFKVQAQ